MSFKGWSEDEKHLYFTIKEQTIRYSRMEQPFTYPYRLAMQGKKKHNVPVLESFMIGTNKGLDHYNHTKQFFPKYAIFNSVRHAAYKVLDHVIEGIEDNKPYEEEQWTTNNYSIKD